MKSLYQYECHLVESSSPLTVPVRQLYSPQTVGVIVVSLELQFELHIVLGLPDHPHEETQWEVHGDSEFPLDPATFPQLPGFCRFSVSCEFVRPERVEQAYLAELMKTRAPVMERAYLKLEGFLGIKKTK